MVEVTLTGRCFTVNAATSRVLPPMGSGDWSIELPDGGQLRFTDTDFGRELCEQFGESLLVDRLERSIAINLVIAWRVMVMTLLGREVPELPAEVMFTEIEIEVLAAWPIFNTIGRKLTHFGG